MRFTFTTATLTVAALGLYAVPAQADLALLDFSDGTRGTARGAEYFSDGANFKPRMTVVDDTAGLGSGNALRLESAGGGSEWYIPLDEAVTLGPNVGDKIIVSLDFRVDLTVDPIGSATADLRFGLFNDNDNSLGQAFGLQTDGVSPAVFGVDDGDFANSGDSGSPIAPDFSVHARMGLNLNVPDANDPFALLNTRLRTETEGDLSVLSGSGNTLASPGDPPALSDSPNGITEGGTNWLGLRDESANTISMIIERTMYAFDDEAPEEEAYRGTLVVTNQYGTTVMSGVDPIAQLERDTFHYMTFINQSSNFDYLVDNISVTTVTEGGGLAGDANGDGSVDLLDLSILATNFDGANTPYTEEQGDFNGDGYVDLLDLSILANNFGTTSTVPEPTTAGLLSLCLVSLMRRR